MIPVKNPAFFSSGTDDEMVLVNADTAGSIALTNHTAVYIWELINGRNNIQELIDQVIRKYHNVPASVKNEVLDLIELLLEEGFIGFEIK